MSDQREVQITEFRAGGRDQRVDLVAAEEPMETRVVFGPESKRTVRSVAVTMRTPGHDIELALGFLFAEGLIHRKSDVISVEVKGNDVEGNPTGNIVRVDLSPENEFDLKTIQRSFFTHSSCGVCGKSSLEALAMKGVPEIEPAGFGLPASVVGQLPKRLRQMQPAFDATGGIHAAGLADALGHIDVVREDVGRHNAVDKLLGYCFERGLFPVNDHALVVSGRASFELVQKAIVAGIPAMIAVGAPSSLAVEMARRYRLTLVGFASEQRFNVYNDGNQIIH